MALGSTPGSSTFLFCPSQFSEVFGHNGMIQESLIRPELITLQTQLIGVLTIGLSCNSAQILHYNICNKLLLCVL